MNYIKRAFLYLTKKKREALQIILVFTVLSSLIMVAYSVRSAAKVSCGEIRRQLGSTVSLRHKNGVDPKTASPITPEMAVKLGGMDNVKGVDVMDSAAAKAVDFVPFGASADGSAASDGDVYAYGATNTDVLYEFKSGSSKLFEGRYIDQTDAGRPVVMIEKSLAEWSKIELGDTLTLAAPDGSNAYKHTVVGIYENTSKDVVMLSGSAMKKENKLYVPPESVAAISGKAELDQIVVTLKDPAFTDQFLEKAAQAISLPGDCILDANDIAYRKMAGPLDNIILLGSVTSLVAAVVGVVILALIVTLTTKERRYEIGVLLSLGEKKAKIIAQLVLEILLPVLIAVTLSVGVGYAVSQNIGKQLLQSQIASSENRNRETNTEPAEGLTADIIQVKPIAKDIAALYGSGVLVTFLAVSVPALWIARCNPKEILLKIE